MYLPDSLCKQNPADIHKERARDADCIAGKSQCRTVLCDLSHSSTSLVVKADEASFFASGAATRDRPSRHNTKKASFALWRMRKLNIVIAIFKY
jgi:hypothetical protein